MLGTSAIPRCILMFMRFAHQVRSARSNARLRILR